MNILTKAIDEIKYRIPIEILRIAFKDDNLNTRMAPISLDEQILNKVIRPRVLMDCDIVGAEHINVYLDGLTPTYVDSYSTLYQIPLDRTLYRNIISVLSVSYLPYNLGYGAMGGGMGTVSPTGNDITSVGSRIGDSFSTVPILSNANVELVNVNTIIIREQRVNISYILKCVVANEENLNNIPLRSSLEFSNLCIWAIKSYIYRKLIIAIDNAYLVGGQELGSVKNYLDTLTDAEDNYQTFLHTVWRKVAFMSSQTGNQRFIRTQISGAL